MILSTETKMTTETTPSKGFVYVASVDPFFYGMAVVACRTLREMWPDAHVTLFTHKSFIDENIGLFDNVVTDIPVSPRAKMWAMANTPYDVTAYIDVDSMVIHPDIQNIFDQLPEDKDFAYVKAYALSACDPRWGFIDKNMTVVPPVDGAFMLYRKSDLMLEFLRQWYVEYHYQRVDDVEGWKWSDTVDPVWHNFDMFTIWRMLFCEQSEFPDIYDEKFEKYRKLRRFVMEHRWNSNIIVPDRHIKRPRVILQLAQSNFDVLFADFGNQSRKIAEKLSIERYPNTERVFEGITQQYQ